MTGLSTGWPARNKRNAMAEQNNQTPGSATEELNNLISELKQELHMDEPAPLPDRTPAPEPEPLPEPEDEFDIVFDDAYEKPEADPEPAAPQYAVPQRRKRPGFFRRRRDSRRHKRKDSLAMSIFGNVIYFALVAAAAITIAKFAWLCADDVLALTKGDSTATVSISEGDNLNKITEKLHRAGLINYPWLFKVYGKYSHVEEKVSPGVYELNTQYDYHALVSGMQGSYNRMTTTVTIVEGKTCAEIFEQLEQDGVCKAEDLAKTAANYEFDYDFLEGLEYGSANRLEGFLFPDTYEFYLTDDPESVLDKFLANFDERIDENMESRMASIGYNVREILAIASMLQEEAAVPEEMPIISSLLYNRLNSESLRLLQMDSTVFYAADQMGTTFDTKLDNPYNTYVYPGLPAGPIDNPGIEAINAALNPDDTDFYYFATGKDGFNHFYNDWDEFEEFLASDEYVGNH